MVYTRALSSLTPLPLAAIRSRRKKRARQASGSCRHAPADRHPYQLPGMWSRQKRPGSVTYPVGWVARSGRGPCSGRHPYPFSFMRKRPKTSHFLRLVCVHACGVLRFQEQHRHAYFARAFSGDRVHDLVVGAGELGRFSTGRVERGAMGSRYWLRYRTHRASPEKISFYPPQKHFIRPCAYPDRVYVSGRGSVRPCVLPGAFFCQTRKWAAAVRSDPSGRQLGPECRRLYWGPSDVPTSAAGQGKPSRLATQLVGRARGSFLTASHRTPLGNPSRRMFDSFARRTCRGQPGAHREKAPLDIVPCSRVFGSAPAHGTIARG